MGYSSVQIFGRTAAVKAFQNTDSINWALLQGRQLLFKYEGSDKNEGGTQLDQLLKMIAESSGSDAVYTLRWYERDDLPESKPGRTAKPKTIPKFKIYENTPWDGSFNFKMFNQEGEEAPRSRGWSEVQSLKEQVGELKTIITDFVKDRNALESEVGKPDGIAGFFNQLLEVPEMKQAIVGKVVQLFHGVTNKIGGILDPAYQVPAKIAGAETTEAQPIQLPVDQVNKLNAALVILVKADPQFPEHLYKLAMIAQNEPDTYKLLLISLNARK